jgi:hypothetical protein
VPQGRIAMSSILGDAVDDAGHYPELQELLGNGI